MVRALSNRQQIPRIHPLPDRMVLAKRIQATHIHGVAEDDLAWTMDSGELAGQ
ncbi:hypothetical protein M378DRAFT_19465 [Amanita muscaria Koide BX008]|uniref:Uncharacterized protein n=1 Tax=Amanita muscaria (strain Koide BX008) TaxID=946122 RepID=A0A0C2SIV0_AMAMK|nr:hypothetical protein M378DRAFT_19465 [Amanita muscaria Koide BX008]